MTAVVVAMDAVGEEEETAATIVVVAEADVAGAEVPHLKVQNPKLRATELTFPQSDISPLDPWITLRHSKTMNLINLSISGS